MRKYADEKLIGRIIFHGDEKQKRGKYLLFSLEYEGQWQRVRIMRNDLPYIVGSDDEEVLFLTTEIQLRMCDQIPDDYWHSGFVWDWDKQWEQP